MPPTASGFQGDRHAPYDTSPGVSGVAPTCQRGAAFVARCSARTRIAEQELDSVPTATKATVRRCQDSGLPHTGSPVTSVGSPAPIWRVAKEDSPPCGGPSPAHSGKEQAP